MPRVAATLLTFLLAAGWVMSYRWGLGAYAGERIFVVNKGEAVLWRTPSVTEPAHVGLFPTEELLTSEQLGVELGGHLFRFAGFAFGRFDTTTGRDTILAAPLWFPTLVSAWLTAVAWRRHRRRRRGSDRGFPITPTDAGPAH